MQNGSFSDTSTTTEKGRFLTLEPESQDRLLHGDYFETVIKEVIENTRITKGNRKLKLSWENYSTSSTKKENSLFLNAILEDLIKEEQERSNKGKCFNGAIRVILCHIKGKTVVWGCSGKSSKGCGPSKRGSKSF